MAIGKRRRSDRGSSGRASGLQSQFTERFRRKSARRARSLVFEPLEDRRLLAGDLNVRFEFTDLGGQPLTSLQVGDQFLVKAYVRDARRSPTGVFQAYLDVNFDPGLVTLPADKSLHPGEYGAFSSGTVLVSGLIDEVGGLDYDQVAPNPRGRDCLLFQSNQPWTAAAPGTLTFTATAADSPLHWVEFFEDHLIVPAGEINFQTSIEILSGGIRVTPTFGLTTTEGGGTASFEVVLTKQPTASVTIGLSSSDLTEGTVSPASLIFTTANWNVAQRVTVTGVNDDVIDGPVGYTIVTAPAASTDTDYNGKNADDVSVINIDDDATTVSIVATDPSGSEPGTDDGLFTVTLAGGKLAPPGGIIVSYSVGGTATAGADYVAFGGSVIIASGASSADIPVDVVNDQVVEMSESVAVTLTGTNNANVTIHPSQNTATVTISDDDATTVSVTASDAAGSEPGTDDGQFTVTLDGGKIAPPGGIVVNYSVGGTATPGADYTALPGSVTIPAGASSAGVTVDVLNDNVVEIAETVVLTLTSTNHSGATVHAANRSATVSVADDDATTVSIVATDAIAGETGSNGALFTLTLAGSKVAPAGGIVVNYSVGGTATAGADYTALPGSVTIAAGASSATIALSVLDDNVVESSETVIVTLLGTDHPGVTVAPAGNQATATISDNDGTTVSISASDAGGSEPGADDAQFTVTLEGGKVAPPGGIAINYSVGGTASAGSDYAVLAGSVTIPAGASSATIVVDVLDDEAIEPSESVILTLTSTNHPSVSVSTTNKTATATIADDDATTVSVIPSDANGAEPGTDDGQFTVRLDGGKLAPAGGIVVSYTVSGTASAGADYVSLTGSVTVPAGASSVTILVDVLNDQIVEDSETVVLTLTGTNHASVTLHPADNSATVTIADDDATTVSITASDANGAEPGSNDAQFTVTLGGSKLAPAGGILVNYTANGTASSGSDYAALSGSVTIPAGASSATIAVDVLDDQVVEGTEFLTVTLTGTNHAGVTTHATDNQATVMIADDDATTVSITATDAGGGEPGANDGLFTVALAGGKLAPAGGIAVEYTIGGTATGGADYTSLPGSVTIPAGSSSATITVDVLDDNVVELTETVVVTLTGTNHPSAPLHATNRTATVTISDDDATTVSITAGDGTASEPGADSGAFLVALDGDKVAPDGGITVTYTVSGTATPGADYTALTGTATIPAGQSSVTVPVVPVNDNVIENPETVVVTLNTVSHAGVTIHPSRASATVTVNDDDATTVSISAVDGTASEPGSDGGQFLVVLGDGKVAPTGGIQVSYTVGGTATPGSDYAALPGTVTIAAGESSATIAVDVLDDNVVELTEQVTVTLSSTNHPGATIHPSNNAAAVTIADDDATTVSISATDAGGSEPGGNDGLLTVALDGGKVAPPGGIVVTYGAGGSATGGADYALLAGSLTIAAGASTATILIDVLDDNVIELPETVIVTLTGVNHPAVSLSTAGAQAEVTIADDDATTVAITASDADGSEPGADDGQFEVRLAGGKTAPPGGILVTYAVSGTAAPGADYVALTGAVTIPAGASSAVILVDVLDDNLAEAAETVIVSLTGTDHPSVTVSSAESTATVTIACDDAAVVGVTGPEPADEGDSGSRLLEFAVTLSAPVDVPVTVDYATADGTAEDENGDHDYDSQHGTLTFEPGGSLTQTVTVAVRGDMVIEPDETFRVILSNLNAGTPARNVSLGDAQAVATIVDDDAARLTIAVTQAAAEDATHGLFTITTDKLLSQPIQVLLAVSGTATPDEDYVTISPSLTFPADARSVTVPVTVLADSMIEGDETVVVQILGTSDPAARPGTPDSATLTIADDEATTVSIAADDGAGSEPGADDGRFVITLGGGKVAPPQGILVYYAVSGTATADEDYVALPVSVTILGGRNSAAIAVDVLDDNVVEPTETVVVTLLGTNNAGATVDPVNHTATVWIADDDTATVSIDKVHDGVEAATPTNGKFRVTLTKVSATDTVLSYTVAGTALPGAGNDYATLSGTVTIMAGDATADIEVAVLDDDIVEDTETVVVTLEAVTSGDEDISIDSRNATAQIGIADEDTAMVSIARIEDGAEGAVTTSGRFRVTQTLPSATDTVLSYTVSGTATHGDDYAPLSGSVTIPAGATAAHIDIVVLDDSLVEDNETVVVTLADITSGDPEIAVGEAGRTATLIIADDDKATVSIAKVDDGVEDNLPTNGKFRVTQTLPSATDTVVSYTVSGTATHGDDYASVSGSVIIPAGATTVDLDIVVLNDDWVEGGETVTVTLIAVTSGDPDIAIDDVDNSATLLISDDDMATVSVEKVAGGAEAPTPANGRFRVVQTRASVADTVLSYTVSGTAMPGDGNDYTPLSGTVTIAAGSLAADIDVAVLDDDLVEGTETVIVTLTGITSAAPGVSIDAATPYAFLEILDDDEAAVSITKVDDGAEGAVPADGRFLVTQTKPSDTDTVLTYLVTGTATPGAGEDYTPLAGTLTIAAGQTSAEIVVSVLNDLLVEETETVIVTLSAITSGDPDVVIDQTNKTATVSILDEIASVSIEASDATAGEPGADEGHFLVALAGGRQAPPGGIRVSYTVSGSATPGADYTALAGVATIPSGQSSVSIPVVVLDDNVVELPETVVVTLTGVDHPNVAIETAANQAIVTIDDDDPTTVSIVASDPSGSEPGTDDGEFTVTLDGGKTAPAGGVTVSYTVSGTAIGGEDYTALTGTVTIPAGQSSITIPVDVLDDNIVELPETVILTLTGTNHPGVTVQAAADTATVTIHDGGPEDADATTVSIAATDATGSEPGTDDGQFTVTLAGGKLAPNGGVTVTYTVGGSATPGSDYTALSGTVTIPAGQSSAIILVDVLNDDIVELPETVVVTLTGTDHPGVTIAATENTAIVTISDDIEPGSDATTVSIAATDAVGSEPGADNGLFTVTLAGGKLAPTGGITVNYTVSGTATAGTDYTALTGTVTIPAGASSATILVDVLDDNIVEAAETVIVALTSTNHAAVTVDRANNAATVTINDDDPTTVSIAASDATGSEPGTDDGAFTVTLAGGKLAPAGGIAVTYTVAGTATAGADYTTLTGTVTIPAGQSSATILVDVLDDNVVETPEAVILTLTGTNHAGATIHATNNTATVTIDSSDDNTTVSISATDATGREPGTDGARLTVTLANSKVAPDGGIVVNYNTSGTATAGSDYTALPGTVAIPAGASSATIAVSVLDDNVVESAETVIVTLTGTNHAGATIASINNSATVTIEDDDSTTVSISASDANAGEPSNNGQFTVTLDNGKVAPAGGIVVNYTTAGTATAGSDYTSLPGTVTILAGQPSATIPVNVIDDTTADEPAETVVVTLASTNHPSVSISTASPSATVTIAADDLRNASISGVVWIDANNDRQQQKNTSGSPLEPGIPGVTVRLTGTARDGSTLELEAMTDGDGAYRFFDLPAGTYEIREEHPAAWIDGPEMLASSTANDTYSNIVLTPSQNAVDYSFGERTLQPQFVSKRQFLASTPATDVYLRELNALAKQRAGDAAGAQAIRDAGIPSEVSAGSTAAAAASAQVTAPESSAAGAAGEGEAAQTNAEAADVNAKAPPAEGEAAPKPAASSRPSVEVAFRTDSRPAAMPAASEALDVRRSLASAASSKPAPESAAFPTGERAACEEVIGVAGLQPSSQSQSAQRDDRAAAADRRASSAFDGSQPAAQLCNASGSAATSTRKAEENLEPVALVDLVFAEDAWLDAL